MHRLLLALMLALGPEQASIEAEADALVQQGDLEGAFALLEGAYAQSETPNPRLLFAMGVIKFKQDDCGAAVQYMGRFLALAPRSDASAKAEDVVRFCEPRLREATAAPPRELESSKPPASSPESESPSSESAELEPVDLEPPTGDGPPRHWARDPTGATLLGVGLVATATGAGLLGQGAVDREVAAASDDEVEFAQRRDRSRSLFIAGGIVSGVGVALLVGAGIRYALVKRSQTTIAAIPSVSGGLFVVSGRF